MLLKPCARKFRDLLQSAAFLEEMGRAFDYIQTLFAMHRAKRRFIQLDDFVVFASYYKEHWRNDFA